MPDDPSGYATALLQARKVLDAFEQAAALFASGQADHLPATTRQAHAAVIACWVLAAWCERQGWASVGDTLAGHAAELPGPG